MPTPTSGYYRDEFVVQRGWLDDREFADLAVFCQFLPGPASSQMGIAVGIKRAGLAGGLAAWLGFALSSAAIMVGFGYRLVNLGDAVGTGWLQGLRIMVVAVVARAIWGMGRARALCADARRAALALFAAALAVQWPALTGGAPGAQIAAIVARGPWAPRRSARERAPATDGLRAQPSGRRRLCPVLRLARALAGAGPARYTPAARRGRRVLPFGRAGLRRRARGAAASAGGSGAARLGL